LARASLAGKKDDALASEKAVAAAWTAVEHMTKDTDPTSLRGGPRHRELLGKLGAGR
jgi:hypothetical protein